MPTLLLGHTTDKHDAEYDPLEKGSALVELSLDAANPALQKHVGAPVALVGQVTRAHVPTYNEIPLPLIVPANPELQIQFLGSIRSRLLFEGQAARVVVVVVVVVVDVVVDVAQEAL